MKTILTIPGRVHGLNGKEGLLNLHYRRRAELKEKWTWLFLSQARGNQHPGRVKITITRYCVRELQDYDNLAATMKMPLDCVKKANIITDDKMKTIGQPTLLQVRVPDAAHEKYIIEIEDLPL